MIRQKERCFSASLKSRLSQRLLIGALILSSAVALAFSAIQLYSEYRSDLKSIGIRLDQIETTSVIPISAAAWQYDRNLLGLQLDSIIRTPDIFYAKLSTEGFPFIERGILPRANHRISRTFFLSYHQQERNETIGSLEVVASKEPALWRLWRGLGFELTSQVLKTLVVSSLLLVYFHFLVTSRVQWLTQVMNHLEPGNLHLPIKLSRAYPFKRDDELDYCGSRLEEIRRSLLNETTERRRAERTIDKLLHAIDHSPVAIMICNQALEVQYSNPQFLALTNTTYEELQNVNIFTLLTGLRPENCPQSHPVRKALALPEPWEGELSYDGSAAEQFWRSIKIAPFLDDNTNDQSILVLIEDITERKYYEHQLCHQANYDALTELPNRSLATDRLEQALAKAQRNG